MRWGYFNGINPTVTFAQSANPEDLQSKVSALVAAAVAREEVLSAVELAGAGDGDIFTVRMESGPVEVFVPLSTSTTANVNVLLAFAPLVYMADNVDELAVARARVWTPVIAPPLAVVGSEMAGATQARRVCVLEMVGSLTLP